MQKFMISEKNKIYIMMLNDIFDISNKLNTRTYIGGGMVIDILEGAFQREHGDLDGFILDMDIKLEKLISLYENKEYEVSYDRMFCILKIEKENAHAACNVLHVNNGIAQWQHIGKKGSVYFPFEWLDSKPIDFYNTQVYTSNIRFEYGLRKIVPLINPQWNKPREKDIEAINYLDKALIKDGISKEAIEKSIWSYNPFWIEHGYDAFEPPVLVCPKR